MTAVLREYSYLLGALPLVALCAFALWERIRRKAEGESVVLIAVGRRKKWRIRPPVLTDPTELSLLRDVGSAIENAGLGEVKVLNFLGRPTMDLVIEVHDATATAVQLDAALAPYPVHVSVLGRRGDLKCDLGLWRYW